MPEATGEGKTMAFKVLRYTVIWIPRPPLVKLHRKPVRGLSMHGASVRLRWLGQVVALALAASAFAQPAEIATDNSNAPFGITLAGPAPAVLPQRLPSIISIVAPSEMPVAGIRRRRVLPAGVHQANPRSGDDAADWRQYQSGLARNGHQTLYAAGRHSEQQLVVIAAAE